MKKDSFEGYDAALTDKRNDDLGRWRFAAEIAHVVRSTPPEWSVRVGIFGKWGEGKSTVLHFLESMFKPEGDIIFPFNPWAIRSLDEMWTEFGTQLLEALQDADLFVEPRWKAGARVIQKKLETSGLADIGEGIAGVFGKDKIVKSAFGYVGNWLKPDGPQVKKIRESLGERRVVVIIDDLDRATPELLPKILLSLREVLDLPGFTFILAFDNEIVADGLFTANKAWGDGANFLDKILDFHYYLPPVSQEGKRRLLKRMLDRYCNFVPLDSIKPIEHLLPDNPRKLKILIRGLISLKPQLDRHGEDELDWSEIWLAEMVRQESYPFFMRLLDDDTLDDVAGIGYRLKNKSSRNSVLGKVAVDNKDIEALIEDVGHITAAQSTRLIELIDATRSIAGMRLQYNWKFALRPEALTWKEFWNLLSQWKADPRAKTLSSWIAEHAKVNSIDRTDIEGELFDTLLNSRHNATSEAASAPSAEDNARHCAEAAQILEMTQQFLGLPNMFTADRFELLSGKSQYWIAFRKNPADAALREVERKTLLALLSRAPAEMAPALLKALAPWDKWAFAGDDAETTKLKRQLRADCVEIILPKVERAFVASLVEPNSVRSLASAEYSPAFTYILFDPDRLPWGKPIRDALLALVRTAATGPIQYGKVLDLLRLLVEASQDKISSIGRQSVQSIVSDKKFTSALWRGVTSRPIQFRMLNLYLSYRSALVTLGADEHELPLTPELEAAAASGQAAKAGAADEEPGPGEESSDTVDSD